MRHPIITLPERDLQAIEDKVEAQRFKEARIEGYVDRFTEYMQDQARAQSMEGVPRNFSPFRTVDLDEHRQSVDMASIENHDWADRKNLEELKHFSDWIREERMEMRREDFKDHLVVPDLTRRENLFEEREDIRDKYSEMFRETFDTFQEQRNIERFATLERQENRNIKALNEREQVFAPDRSHTEPIRDPEPIEPQRTPEPEPERQQSRMSAWLDRIFPPTDREVQRDEPAIERDEPTISR